MANAKTISLAPFNCKHSFRFPVPQPRIMITGNLLTCLSLLILLFHFLQTSHANEVSPYCSPSTCGLIRNISYPFRLQDDPKHCGDPKYELACEDNVTSIYLNSQKYHVKAINYHNFTIRLADVSININTCSFPKYSAYRHNFSVDPLKGWSKFYIPEDEPNTTWPVHVNFMSCPYRLNSSLFTEINDCANRDNFVDASNSSSGRHTYIKVGDMNVSDVKHLCRVDFIVMTSWKFKDFKNISVSEIHESLLYGFELSWSRFRCSKCKGISYCLPYQDHTVTCVQFNNPATLTFAYIIVIVGFFAVVSIPAEFIFGFMACFGLFLFLGDLFRLPFSIMTWPFLIILPVMLIGAIHAAKLIIAFPCLMGLVIYKFRRRHLSMFDAIECFLRSDNKLMPVRYSYSDIKKMTRGFREKIGEGGYGSVYKGKLRSGHDVAVKILGKPRANGQEFVNEIATIGRIHHVNIIKLVGYCAERSKRALVFDFMPNGSLEKHIYSREKMNSLNWEKKYDIAVGVAQGIEYLHRGCDIQILHFDIKPHNILLDDKFIPKITDFGLAKFCSTEKNTITLTAARGTIGYVAPELINRSIGGVSYKADVYSFGMLLMEIVGLNRELIGNNEASSQYFPYWIYDCFDQGKDIEIGKVDENDVDNDNDNTRKLARKMTIVALWCIQMRPCDRPSMNEVVKMLEGEVEHLQIPPRPSQTPQVPGSTDSVSLLCHNAASSVEIIVQEV